MEISDKLENYWRDAMRQPAHQLVSKVDRMLQAAGLAPIEADVFRDPLFQDARKTEYREQIQQAIYNWRHCSDHFSNAHQNIVYKPDDPVAAYRKLERHEQESNWQAISNGQPLSMPTLTYVQCQEELCYALLSCGVGERQIAADTKLDVQEVREIAGRHNITPHL